MLKKIFYIIICLMILSLSMAWALELPKDVDPAYQLNLSNTLDNTIATFKTALNLLFFLLVVSISSNVLMFFSLNKAQNQLKEALQAVKEVNSFKETVLDYLRKQIEGGVALTSIAELPEGSGEEIEILESQKLDTL
jgi:hypothetical protein